MNSSDQEMINFLQSYIQIPTSMPDPQYEKVGELFRQHALTDGIAFMRHLLPSGYPCFIITMKGSDNSLPSLLLNHHMDVVPVLEPAAWISDPFEGTIIDGAIIGRGVQDTKGVGAVHYFALRELMREGVVLRRTVHIILVPDEERGGFHGTQEIMEQPFFKKLNIGFVCDEGPSSGDPSTVLIKVDERRPLQMRISTTGTAGHGSHLHIDNAVHRLCIILERITAYQKAQREKTAHCDAGTTTSINITSINAGASDIYNVVPAIAHAAIDIRIAPSDSCAAIKSMIEMICAEADGTSTILATVPDREQRPELSQTLVSLARDVVKKYEMQIRTVVSEGASDLRFYWERGIVGIGFAPFTSPYNAHGINESLTVAELVKAKNIMRDFITALCCKD